jgi:transcriptional regulator of aromatic amino acid metabolism
MLVMNSPETTSFSDLALLRMLSSRSHRPNLMVRYKQVPVKSVLEQLTPAWEAPIQVRRFPGILDLPPYMYGTLVLADIDQLTISQQIWLSDWLGRKGNDVQIVSITRAPMDELVFEGRFLEGLFYRLNTVVVRETDGRTYQPSW